MPKKTLLDFTKNFSYTFTSNILSLLISVVIAFVIPKLISVEQYGYYQLNICYSGYTGISFLGFCEGFYLRTGGKYYDDLDKPLYSTQFRLLGIYELIVFAAIFCWSLLFIDDKNKHFVIVCVCVAAVGMCLRWFLTYILQATARIKDYAFVTIAERILYVLVAVPMVFAGYRGFELLIIVDVAAKYISLLIGVWFCRDMVFSKTIPVKSVIPEIKENIAAGFKFMLALLCDMLIIGVVRFGVQSYWNIATFSKVSVTLTVSNLVMTAINAIAVVMYPTLRRTNEGRLPALYRIMRIVLVGFAFGALIFYYPIQRILTAWLPQYAESLRYAAILFPICMYQSKMSLLVNTYYKTLRLENLLMKCNMAALILSIICTVVSTFVLNSVTAAILSILIALIFRCILSELLLSKHIDIDVKLDIVIELVMTAAFIICNWYFGLAGMIMYAVCYLVYLVIKRKDILESLNFIKSMR